MKKLPIYVLFLFAVVLMSFQCTPKDPHDIAKIVNNSDEYIVATVDACHTSTNNDFTLNVKYSSPNADGASSYAPHTTGIFMLERGGYFESFYAPPGSTDRVRFFFIDKELYDSKGENPRNLAPDDFIAHIDLSISEMKSMNWTIRFPEDVIFKEESAE